MGMVKQPFNATRAGKRVAALTAQGNNVAAQRLQGRINKFNGQVPGGQVSTNPVTTPPPAPPVAEPNLDEIYASNRGGNPAAPTTSPAAAPPPAPGVQPYVQSARDKANNVDFTKFNLEGATKTLNKHIASGNKGEAAKLQNRINRYNAYKASQNPAVPPPPAAETPAPPTPETPATPATPDTGPQFKPVEDFMPANGEEDPMFKQQMEMGQKRMDKYLSARGLADSGAQYESIQNLSNQALSDQYGRNIEKAGLNSQLYQQFGQNVAEGNRAAGNDQWGRIQDILSLMAAQSPMNNAYGASSGIANSYTGEGQSIGGRVGNNYFNMPTGGGGGGGGGYVPPYTNSNIDAAYAGAGNANNANFANIITQFLGNLGGRAPV